MNAKQLLSKLLPLGVLGIAGVITWGLIAAKPEVEEEKAEFPPLAVKIHTAEESSFDWSVQFEAEVRAQTTIDLVAEVTGRITSINENFSDGGKFAADAVLLTIEQADYLLALESARAAVAQAQTGLEIEKGTAEIRKKQWADLKKSTKAKPLQLNEPQVAQAEAQLKAARAQLAKARLDLQRTKVSAPFEGRVLNKVVGLGQFVSKGTALGRVFSTDRVEIRLPMTDTQLADLGLTIGYKPEDPSQAPKATISHNFAGKALEWEGRLFRIDGNIDPMTRLIYATVIVENPLSKEANVPLAPGLFVDVSLAATSPVVAVSVPRNALRRGDQVYVVADGKLGMKTVSVLRTSASLALIDSGLSSGEQVITSPIPGAYDGMAVSLSIGKGEAKEAADASVSDVDPDAESAAQ